MSILFKTHPALNQWQHWLTGCASLADGFIIILSFGFISGSLRYEMSMYRMHKHAIKLKETNNA